MSSFDEERVFDLQRRAYIRYRNKQLYEEQQHKRNNKVEALIFIFCLMTIIIYIILL